MAMRLLVCARVLAFAWIAVSLQAGENTTPLLGEKLQDQVDQAVRNGREHLLSRFKKDPGSPLNPGEKLLAGYALLKTGSDPLQEPLLSLISGKHVESMGGTYEAGIYAMLLSEAFEAVDAGRDPSAKDLAIKIRKDLKRIAEDLVASQQENGSWGYFRSLPYGGGEARGDPKNNLSTSQFALLGLHAASRRGAAVPRETWENAMDYLLKGQTMTRDYMGGWGYREKDHKHYPGGSEPYGSMTAVGVASVEISGAIWPPTRNASGGGPGRRQA